MRERVFAFVYQPARAEEALVKCVCVSISFIFIFNKNRNQKIFTKKSAIELYIRCIYLVCQYKLDIPVSIFNKSKRLTLPCMHIYIGMYVYMYIWIHICTYLPIQKFVLDKSDDSFVFFFFFTIETIKEKINLTVVLLFFLFV